jgi:predicted nucleic acid-binding protein
MVIVCPVVFSEVLAHPTASEKGIQQFFLETGIQVDYRFTDAFWRKAGLAYAQYAARRRKSSGDQPRRIIADYLIGAHALLNADGLMTLDPSTYQRDFPELRLITP